MNHRAEQEIINILMKEIKKSINSLKIWKVPVVDELPAELIKYRRKVLHKKIHELCLKIRKHENHLRNGTGPFPFHYI